MKKSIQELTQRTRGWGSRMCVTHDATGGHISINMNAPQLALLDQAYNALRESVYDALVVQTRLKPYLDDISLTLDANGNFNLDFAVLDAGCRGAANDAVFELRRVG